MNGLSCMYALFKNAENFMYDKCEVQITKRKKKKKRNGIKIKIQERAMKVLASKRMRKILTPPPIKEYDLFIL